LNSIIGLKEMSNKDVFVNVTGVSMNTKVELDKNDDKRTSKQSQTGTPREEKPVGKRDD
tara:strand:+ start:333 stop:509 length:177 start_codon:yes stop_codon:yes gene_type:complete